MPRLPILIAAAGLLAAACEPLPVDPERVARDCEERARAAQGPTGEVTVGVNSEDGPFFGTEIGITSDFIAGRDPLEVYEQCVVSRTGAPPIRPPAL